MHFACLSIIRTMNCTVQILEWPMSITAKYLTVCVWGCSGKGGGLWVGGIAVLRTKVSWRFFSSSKQICIYYCKVDNCTEGNLTCFSSSVYIYIYTKVTISAITVKIKRVWVWVKCVLNMRCYQCASWFVSSYKTWNSNSSQPKLFSFQFWSTCKLPSEGGPVGV